MMGTDMTIKEGIDMKTKHWIMTLMVGMLQPTIAVLIVVAMV